MSLTTFIGVPVTTVKVNIPISAGVPILLGLIGTSVSGTMEPCTGYIIVTLSNRVFDSKGELIKKIIKVQGNIDTLQVDGNVFNACLNRFDDSWYNTRMYDFSYKDMQAYYSSIIPYANWLGSLNFDYKAFLSYIEPFYAGLKIDFPKGHFLAYTGEEIQHILYSINQEIIKDREVVDYTKKELAYFKPEKAIPLVRDLFTRHKSLLSTSVIGVDALLASLSFTENQISILYSALYSLNSRYDLGINQENFLSFLHGEVSCKYLNNYGILGFILDTIFGTKSLCSLFNQVPYAFTVFCKDPYLLSLLSPLSLLDLDIFGIALFGSQFEKSTVRDGILYRDGVSNSLRIKAWYYDNLVSNGCFIKTEMLTLISQILGRDISFNLSFSINGWVRTGIKNAIYTLPLDDRGYYEYYYLAYGLGFRYENKTYDFHNYGISLILASMFNTKGCNQEFDFLSASIIPIISKSSVTYIDGIAGSGKSTFAVNFAREYNASILTPTAKSAVRLRDIDSSLKAKTVHSALGFYDEVISPFVKREKVLSTEFLILDEGSMFSARLLFEVFTRCQFKHLIMLGDSEQLEPIDYGAPFKELRDYVYYVKVTKQYRYNSEIEKFSKNFIQGSWVFDGLSKLNSIVPYELKVLDVPKYLSSIIGNVFLRDVQIISPVIEGPIGTDNLNNIISSMNNSSLCLSDGKKTFKLGDRVIQNNNDYFIPAYDLKTYPNLVEIGKGRANGQVGHVIDIRPLKEFSLFRYESPSKIGVVVKYSDCIVIYTTSEILDNYGTTYSVKGGLDNLSLGYAITVHKAQGSEFPIVVAIAYSVGGKDFVTKEMLYTMFTRTKSKLYILTDSINQGCISKVQGGRNV